MLGGRARGLPTAQFVPRPPRPMLTRVPQTGHCFKLFCVLWSNQAVSAADTGSAARPLFQTLVNFLVSFGQPRLCTLTRVVFVESAVVNSGHVCSRGFCSEDTVLQCLYSVIMSMSMCIYEYAHTKSTYYEHSSL